MAFLAKHGLKAERVNVSENMPKLHSLDRVSPEQATAIREGMKHSAFWRITPSGKAVSLPPTETEGFHVNASIQDGTLSLALTGRLDTITAPSLLSFFEKTKSGQSVDAVDVDCGRLDYISSAGLRVLLMMYKSLENKDNFEMTGVSEEVLEILETTGFDQFLLK